MKRNADDGDFNADEDGIRNEDFLNSFFTQSLLVFSALIRAGVRVIRVPLII